jgi:VWFA-related protein
MQAPAGRMCVRLFCIVASVACAVGLTIAAAQDQPPRLPFHTEANYVRVDAYPTRDGAPIADLRQDDFEILEDKLPQKIEQFEHVVIRGGGPQETRREPNTVAESRQAVEDSRARLFVLFLDVNHVEAAASRTIRAPFVKALDNLIGQDDLIAVMTPGMSARDITFARRTTTIEGILEKNWWGERDKDFRDPVEERYAACYPGIPPGIGAVAADQGIAQEMILRRREQQTLDALEDLVTALRDVREERKAILLLSDGWRLFGPNDALRRPTDGVTPRIPTVGVDPRTGKLTADDTRNASAGQTPTCERDRIALSQLNDQQRLREIVDESNRANASFYTIDPRGLVVFDEQIVPSSGVGIGPSANPTVGLVEDSNRLTARHESLRTLADATDGLSIIETSDFARGLKRIVDDLSSYYLLGYYSTGKLDGRFHSITVRVKRPGVNVRARRGYLAPTAAQARARLTAATTPAATPGAAAAGAHALDDAIGSLNAVAREAPLRVHVAAGWTPAGGAACWVVVEAGRVTANDDWVGGGQADVLVIDKAGATVATGRGQIAPGTSSVQVALTSGGLAPGDYDVRVRAKSAGATAASTDALRFAVAASPNATGALFFRRGQTTANKDVPTADLRFRRMDQLRLDVPTPSADAVTARLLDRTGKAMAIPITSAVRDDGDGSRWRTARVSLAPFAPGDYVVELTAGAERSLYAFRVVP